MRFIVFCILILLPTFASAQKDADNGPIGIFPNRQAYDQFMTDAKRSIRNNPEMKAMIPFINDVALGKPIGWTGQKYSLDGGQFGMLANDQVRADLEMDEDQYEELKKLNEDIRRRAAEQLRDVDFSDTKNLVERISKIRDESQAAMGSVLLPHQKKRLSQLRRRSQLRYRSLAELLTSEPIRDELDLTDRQADDLLSSEKEIEEKLRKDIAELREKAREKLLKRLNREQRKQVEDMLGDSFEFEQNSKEKQSVRKYRKK